MKLQYLGDSRDSFKWDYHDYLTASLGYPLLNVAFMMTPDDNANHGNTNPEQFPARQDIIDFCNSLRTERDTRKLREKFDQGNIKEVSRELGELIGGLPTTTTTRPRYSVHLHKGAERFTNINRMEYFSDIREECRQVLFLDPDIGFEPIHISDKHVSYSDIESMLQQVSEKAVISVFQYFNFIPFPEYYNRIKQRLTSGYSTAINTHSVMFVAISKSEKTIDKVRSVNIQYSQDRPVRIIR